jgi:dsDNA-specific endonuclease/ATPase MutS2
MTTFKIGDKVRLMHTQTTGEVIATPDSDQTLLEGMITMKILHSELENTFLELPANYVWRGPAWMLDLEEDKSQSIGDSNA